MTSRSDNYWWDGRYPDSFFPAVYRSGDDSFEGNLDEQLLDLEQRTMRECDLIESILKLPTGARILDCPCGYGRHSIELATRGYDVIGVDLCPQFIDEAIERTRSLPKDAMCRFIQGDMRNLPTSLGTFDASLNMFLSFGFFGDDDNLQVLRECYRVLRPGGKLLIHTDINPDRVTLGCFCDRHMRKLKDGSRLQIEESFDVQTKTLRGTWTIERNHVRQTSRSYSIRIYTHDEIAKLLKTAGFSDVVTVFPANLSKDADRPPQEVVYVGIR